MATIVRRKGECGVCGHLRQVRKDGVTGVHAATVDGVVVPGTRCAGEGTAPKTGTVVTSVMFERGPTPRGVCVRCARSVALRADGAAGSHGWYEGGYRIGLCPGVGGPVVSG